MYCFKCGKQIRDDAVFCQYCGTQQGKTSNISIKQSNAVNNSNSGELDREALKIYLRNVLSLECIKANYERKLSNLQYNISQLNDNYLKKYVLRKAKHRTEEYCVHFLYNGKLNMAWSAPGFSYGPYMQDHLCKDNYTWKCINKDSDIDFLRKSGRWDHFDDYDCFILERWAQREEARDAFFSAYAEFKAVAPKIYQNNVVTNTRKRNNWQQQLSGISRELEATKCLLKKAYDINIIPSQFRYKIYAIYYLYDFMSTSRESFTTALLHRDLNEIKAKLDKIIAQQESIIIQNAVRIAQNEKLSKQNQQQLEHLSRIELNTSQAKQYAQVAANNAEICAWINMAKYIEKHR